MAWDHPNELVQSIPERAEPSLVADFRARLDAFRICIRQ